MPSSRHKELATKALVDPRLVAEDASFRDKCARHQGFEDEHDTQTTLRVQPRKLAVAGCLGQVLTMKVGKLGYVGKVVGSTVMPEGSSVSALLH